MFVQFDSSEESKIIAAFCGPQDPDCYPNQGQVEDADQRYMDYINPPVNIVAVNGAMQAELSYAASIAMTPLLVSLQLGNAASDETARATAWQSYYRALQAVDLTVASPTWPTQPA